MENDPTPAQLEAERKLERARLKKAAGRLGWKLIGRETVEIRVVREFRFGPRTVVVRGRVPVPTPTEMTAEEGERLGFAVDIAPPLEDEGRPVSSGAVRAALAEGKVVDAAELLGAPWFASGEVVHGDKRGRELGFPTANIKLDPSCGLKHGIYAVRVGIGDKRHDGVASFGVRPMFDDGAPLLEVYLFDFDGDLYGNALDVAFIGWIRPEQKLADIAALKRQMAADAAQARDALKRAGKAFPVLGKV